jgi:glycine dehydrogenase subunit 2
VADAAVLNANWLRHRLRGTYDLPYDRPAMHEFVASVAGLKKTSGLRAVDVAKCLLDEGFHAPTVYFPLIVEEALMIEPTETESPQTVEALAQALIAIASSPVDDARQAPRTTPVRRPDEARAARRLVPTWDVSANGEDAAGDR